VPEARANGVSLHVEERGAGAPILCIHGSGSSAAFWGDALAELGTRGRAIAYDRRGHFRSERPDPYATNVHEHADDAAALLVALESAPAVVIGRSYGGAVALDLALRRPELVRALALLEGDAPSLDERSARWVAEVETQVLAAAERDPSTVGETLLRTVAGDAWDSFPESAREILTGNGPAIVAELRAGFPVVTCEQLGGIGCPTLFVSGEDSPSWVAELAERMAAAMPAARADVVGGGHLVDPAHPVVLAFVDEVLARP